MHRARTILGWLIFIVALAVILIPLPGEDQSHLMSISEANDDTLVILTTDDPAALEPLVDLFVAKQDAQVRIEAVETASPEAVQKTHADLILVKNVSELVPLVQAEVLDTLPLDLMWNILSDYRDPAHRWIGYTGRLNNSDLEISALALAHSANSKPLAQLFLSMSYLPSAQQLLAESTHQFVFLAFGVPTPSFTVDFATRYNSDTILHQELQVASTH